MRTRQTMETAAPLKEIRDEIRAAGGIAFKYCYQCGKCDVVCPWNRVRNFSIRKIIREATFGLTQIESEDVWRCTTCGNCLQKCPRGVEQIELGKAIRRIATKYEVFPAFARSIRSAGASLCIDGNPLNEERQRRGAWTSGLPVKPYVEGMEILYFVGCYLSYDPRLKKVATATATILDRAHVDFGILGEKENCCGESIRKAGAEDVFRTLARENIKTFIDHGVRRILVSSPHCYHTLKNEYPEFMAHFEVVHSAQFLLDLLLKGRLEIKERYDKRVTFHDPCYLGRHNGVFDEPRELLGAIPGLDLVEMANSREDSLCCGGGGGRIWMDTPRDERFSNLRLEQAIDAKADVLATACPYCITMLEESRLSREGANVPIVQDLTEILQVVT